MSDPARPTGPHPTQPTHPARPTPAPWSRLELWRVAVALSVPFEASHGTEERREVVVVRLTDADGAVGWGECDALTRPTYTHEYARGAFAVLRDELGPAMLAAPPEAALPAFARFHPMARAALELARLDLELRSIGRSLGAHLGGGRPALARTAVLGRRASTAELLAALDAAQAGGATLVKLKLAGLDDVAALLAVRAARPDAALAADANGSLEATAPQQLIEAGLDRLGLVYLEQPYGPDALLETAALRRLGRTPIALDETITSLDAARLARAVGAVDILNVKPARLGGPLPAATLLSWAADRGLDAFCGGMVELGIGRAAAAAVASLPGCTLPTDLGPSAAYLAEGAELCTPVRVDGAGRLVVPDGAGLGVAVDVDRVEAAAVARAVLEAPRR